jgi:hypothetical protein
MMEYRPGVNWTCQRSRKLSVIVRIHLIALAGAAIQDAVDSCFCKACEGFWSVYAFASLKRRRTRFALMGNA